MGLTKIIQIPCHHVLSNQNYLKLKKGAPLKQILNINLGIGFKKKLLFLFIFLTYLFVLLLKFRLGELVGCRIKFRIQQVPTWHTSSSRFFRYFLFLGHQGSSKVCKMCTHWMRNLILHPTSSLDQNLSKKTGRYVENTNKKM